MSKIDAESFDPIDYYLAEIKPRLKDNATEYLNDLLKKANVNEEENISNCKHYEKSLVQFNASNKKLNLFKGLATFMWVLFAIGIIGTIFLIFLLVFASKYETTASEYAILSSILVGFVILIIGPLLANILYFNKKIKEYQTMNDKDASTAQSWKNKAYESLQSVNYQFQFNDFNKIVRNTTDMFDIDDYLTPEKLLMIQKIYGYIEDLDRNESVVEVLSGSIKGNPFIRLKVKRQSMFNKTYHGSRVVSYTKTYTDSEGHLRTRTVTETLHASYVAPCPSYGISSYMIYGNCAAERLTFLRKPSGIEKGIGEKDLEKFVKKGEKKLNELANDAIKNGKSFNAMANSKFEVLFGAYNRNDEVQYRLLFTPLAQQNMIEILTGKAGYGDDFYFHKIYKINIIVSAHSGLSYYYTKYDDYYDVRKLKVDYINDICNIFDSIFFDLAPLLAIPLYQSTEGGIFNPDEDMPKVCKYEAESYANCTNSEEFRPKNTKTDQILHASFIKSVGNTDLYTITSQSFQIFPRIYVASVMAGNGVFYPVNVPWEEFIEATANTPISIRNFMGERTDYYNMNKDDQYKQNVNKFSNRGYKNKRFVGYKLKDLFDEECDRIITDDMNRFTPKDGG